MGAREPLAPRLDSVGLNVCLTPNIIAKLGRVLGSFTHTLCLVRQEPEVTKAYWKLLLTALPRLAVISIQYTPARTLRSLIGICVSAARHIELQVMEGMCQHRRQPTCQVFFALISRFDLKGLAHRCPWLCSLLHSCQRALMPRGKKNKLRFSHKKRHNNFG